MDFELLDSEDIYKGRVFAVRRERVRYPDGRLVSLDILHHSGAVTIVPVDAQGEIWFVRQYRHPAGGMLLELPAGTLETGETPEACAQREVREEIGMAAGALERIGAFYLAPGYSTEYMLVYLATQLRHEPLQRDPDEYLRVEKFPLGQVYEMAIDGRIHDAKSVAALFLARRHLASLFGSGEE